MAFVPYKRSPSGKSITSYQDTSTGEILSARAYRDRLSLAKGGKTLRQIDIERAQKRGFKTVYAQRKAKQPPKTKLKSTNKRIRTIYQFDSIWDAIDYARKLDKKRVVTIVVYGTLYSLGGSGTGAKGSKVWVTLLNATRVSMLRTMLQTGELDNEIDAFYENIVTNDGAVDKVNLWVHR